MSVLVEGIHDAEFVVSCANGTRSFRAVTVEAPEGGYEAGVLLAETGGVYTAAAADGTVVAILANGVPEGTREETVMVQDGEVSEGRLIYPEDATPAQITTLNTALEGLGIVVLPTPRTIVT